MIDKLILTNDNDLVMIFSDRSPVIISAEDPIALFEYLQTPTTLPFNDFAKGLSNDLENTALAA